MAQLGIHVQTKTNFDKEFWFIYFWEIKILSIHWVHWIFNGHREHPYSGVLHPLLAEFGSCLFGTYIHTIYIYLKTYMFWLLQQEKGLKRA